MNVENETKNLDEKSDTNTKNKIELLEDRVNSLEDEMVRIYAASLILEQNFKGLAEEFKKIR